MMLPFAPKPRPCAHCLASFTPARMGQRVCSATCARRIVKVEQAAEKHAFKTRKEAAKTLPVLKAEAQHVFNKWVRSRDEKEPCISCGKPPPDLSQLHAGRDAGHYRSIGAAAHLRFHEHNCHAQCVHCNQHKAGNGVDYRIGLIRRIGLDSVDALERDNTPRKFTRDELIAIKATYRAKLKALLQEKQP